MSARAAWRLDSLGFTKIYRYVAGKKDWLAFDLPTAGKRADQPRAGSLLYRDVPLCSPNERLSDVRERLGETPWDVCVAVTEDRVVQGLLALEEHVNDEGPVSTFMRADSRTFRPFVTPKTMLKAMENQKIDIALVTTSAGQLLGAVRRADVAQAAERH